MATQGKPAAGGYYPPVGFHFKVEVLGIGNDNDSRFQSVSGLALEFDVETVKEGGRTASSTSSPAEVNIPTSRSNAGC